MKQVKLTFLGFIIVVIMFSQWGCNSCRNEGNDVDSFVKTRAGKTLVFPDSLTVIHDSKLDRKPYGYVINHAKATIVSVIWGDCEVCVEKMIKWNGLLKEGRLSGVQLVFIVSTPKVNYFLKVLYPMIDYDGVLIIDNKEDFYHLNDLSNATLEYNTFLVDNSFKIVLVGDPIIFPDLMKLYEQTAKDLLNE
jgi:hypothetical protein